MRYSFLILFPLLLCGCDSGTNTISGKLSPSTVVERDNRPPFVLDASKPFVIELGRGSGMHGLDSIKISETGSAGLHRIGGSTNFETASLRLSAVDVNKLISLANALQLTSLGRTYSEPEVADGTQWVLWIQQSPSEKSVYLNNAFPEPIVAFANGLDSLLQSAGLNTAVWTSVPHQQGLDQQTALWAHIEPAK